MRARKVSYALRKTETSARAIRKMLELNYRKCRLTLVVALRRNVLLRPNLPPTKTREALERERCGFGAHDWRGVIRTGYIYNQPHEAQNTVVTRGNAAIAFL